MPQVSLSPRTDSDYIYLLVFTLTSPRLPVMASLQPVPINAHIKWRLRYQNDSSFEVNNGGKQEDKNIDNFTTKVVLLRHKSISETFLRAILSLTVKPSAWANRKTEGLLTPQSRSVLTVTVTVVESDNLSSIRKHILTGSLPTCNYGDIFPCWHTSYIYVTMMYRS